MCSDILFQFFKAFADAKLADLVRFTPFLTLLFSSKYFNQLAFLEPQKATKHLIMKKVFIFLLLINFFSYGQNNCDVLSSKQLKAIKNKSDYESLQKLGLHYFQVYQKSKNNTEKQSNLLKASKFLKKTYNTGKSSSEKGKDFSKITCYYGLTYLKSKGFKRAFHYINESAKMGYLPAMFYLGKLYENGTGTKVDNKKAERYYKRSASLFNPLQALACDRLGRLYYHKLKDDKSAAIWLNKSVNLGHTRSTYLLLNIDDSYGDKIKRVTSMNEATQQASGISFGKDGILYAHKCHMVNPNFDIQNVVTSKKNNKTPQKLSGTEINHLEKLGRNGSMKAYQKLLDYHKRKGNQNGINRYLAKMKDLKKVKKIRQRKIKDAAIKRQKSILQGLYMAGALYGNSAESTKHKKEAYDFVENAPLESFFTVDTPRNFRNAAFKVYINKNNDEYYLFVLMDLYASNPYRTEYNCVEMVKVISNQVLINDAKKNWVRETSSKISKRNEPLLQWKNKPNGY